MISGMPVLRAFRGPIIGWSLRHGANGHRMANFAHVYGGEYEESKTHYTLKYQHKFYGTVEKSLNFEQGFASGASLVRVSSFYHCESDAFKTQRNFLKI